MERISLNVDKTKKYVIACSFGPDSMALLNAAIKENLDIVVAHVNYRKRDVALYEQESLTKFCEERNIKIYVLDLLKVKPVGNFQDWARETRYKFFKKVAKETNAYAVLVAHQQDDLIETYLMQKKRGNFVKNPGISCENELFGVKIIRPLLGYSKRELQEYDEYNKVPFSIDESNLTNHYTRNKIRHEIVETMSEDDRKAVLDEIAKIKKNALKVSSIYSKEEFLGFDYSQMILIFDYYMNKTGEHRDISKKFVGEIKKAFKTKTNLRIELTNKIYLELDYGEVIFVNADKLKEYCHEFTRKLKTEFLDIDFSVGTDDRKITNLPEKLVVRNCNKNSKNIIKDYSTSTRRQFINWKMPLYLREIWPGIYDENNNLIYVPRYRKIFEDNHKSKFKIDTNYFLKF